MHLGLPKFLLSTLLLLAVHAVQAEEPAFSFGIVPQQSASKLARLWGPLLQRLGQDSDLKLRFATAPDIPTFEQRLAAGEYDFAYMNPYHYTVFHQTTGYQALARARDKRIRGIMVVRKDSAIDQLADLDGSTLAFPAPAAFAASILTRAHLTASDIDFQPKYVSSHDSVYRTVAKGIYPAGGGVIRTLNNVAPEIREQLRVLWTSRGYTPHAIATHPRVDSNAAQRLRRALVRMDRKAEGATLLRDIRIKGFETARDGDWDDVRGLQLEELSHQ